MINKTKRGITLIEIILYVGIYSFFATGAISFGLNIILVREKIANKSAADLSAQIALSKIAYEIRRSNDIDNITVGNDNITLDNSDGSTTNIFLNANAIFLQYSTDPNPIALTSDQVVVSSLTFTDRSTISTDSKDIEVDIVITNNDITTNKSSSIELNTLFNDSRKLLANYSAADASTGVLLNGMTIEIPAGLGKVVVDQMSVSWVGGDGSENITRISIGGNPNEWSGSASSGELINIKNFSLKDTDGPENVSLTFDSDMTGTTLNIDYVLSDGSVLETKIEIYIP